MKVFITGHRGLAGSALVRLFSRDPGDELILRTRDEVDLANPNQVGEFFNKEKPEAVIHAAARVGGIYANRTYPAEFLHENLSSIHNVIHSAWKHGVKKLIFLSSACVYPSNTPQPVREDFVLTGAIDKTNEAYAIAKIAGIKLCEYYRKQYHVPFISTIPTNIYGPHDNYHPMHSHVIPGLIQKFHKAKEENAPYVTLWGTGNAYREFIHADDLATAIQTLYKADNPPDLVNIGTGHDYQIRELARLIQKTIGYEGEIRFDISQPDGMSRRQMDISKLTQLGWQPKIGLREGLQATYNSFLEEKTAGVLRE